MSLTSTTPPAPSFAATNSHIYVLTYTAKGDFGINPPWKVLGLFNDLETAKERGRNFIGGEEEKVVFPGDWMQAEDTSDSGWCCCLIESFRRRRVEVDVREWVVEGNTEGTVEGGREGMGKEMIN